MTGSNPFSLPEFSVEDPRLWFYRAYVSNVLDGDNLILLLDRGFQDYLKTRVRLAGVDAPELRPREGSPASRNAEAAIGERAKRRLAGLVEHKEVLVHTQQSTKLGRWLAYIYLPPTFDRTVNQLLLDEGLAVPFGKPRPWRGE